MPTRNGEENVLAYLCNKLLPNYISLDLKENEVFSCKHIMLKEEGCQIKKRVCQNSRVARPKGAESHSPGQTPWAM